MDDADKTFKWKCPKCGEGFEENNWGSLEVLKQVHEKQCNRRHGGETDGR